MTDFTRGSPIQRYADVNTLLLKTYSQSCLDFKYTKMVDDMKKTNWNSSAGEGGSLGRIISVTSLVTNPYIWHRPVKI